MPFSNPIALMWAELKPTPTYELFESQVFTHLGSGWKLYHDMAVDPEFQDEEHILILERYLDAFHEKHPGTSDDVAACIHHLIVKIIS